MTRSRLAVKAFTVSCCTLHPLAWAVLHHIDVRLVRPAEGPQRLLCRRHVGLAFRMESGVRPARLHHPLHICTGAGREVRVGVRARLGCAIVAASAGASTAAGGQGITNGPGAYALPEYQPSISPHKLRNSSARTSLPADRRVAVLQPRAQQLDKGQGGVAAGGHLVCRPPHQRINAVVGQLQAGRGAKGPASAGCSLPAWARFPASPCPALSTSVLPCWRIAHGSF